MSTRASKPSAWTARDLLGRKHHFSALPRLVAVGPDDTLRHAANLLQVYNLTQLPVLEGGRPVGALSVTTLLKHGGALPRLLEQPVRNLMEKPLDTVKETAEYPDLLERFKGEPSAILVTGVSDILGVLTPVDVIAPWLTGAQNEYEI